MKNVAGDRVEGVIAPLTSMMDLIYIYSYETFPDLMYQNNYTKKHGSLLIILR